MKSLVVTTGKERPIMDVWLPSLRDKGEYDGDVLIVDYFEGQALCKGMSYLLNSFSSESVEYLTSQKNVIYMKVHNVYSCVASDRIRAFYECLKPLWKQYDVILITDGNDIEFFKPIQPLLNMAETELCAVKEPLLHSIWSACELVPKFPRNYWESIKEKAVLNAGIIAGSPNTIKPLLKFMIKNMKLYSDVFGSEQISLNIWFYHYKHFIRDVGCVWNCFINMGFKISYLVKVSGVPENFGLNLNGLVNSYIHNIYKLQYGEREKCILTTFDNSEIEVAILHMHEDMKSQFNPSHSDEPIFEGGQEYLAKVIILFDLKLDKFNLSTDQKLKVKAYYEQEIENINYNR